MSGGARTRYVVTYDVTNDSTRTRLAKFLLGYGDRVQKSVFEADLTAKDVQDIIDHASNNLAPEDSLRLYRQCGACAPRVQNVGRAVDTSTKSVVII